MDSSQIPTCSTELVSHAGSQTLLPSWVKKKCRNEIKTENLLRQKTFVIKKKCLSKTKVDKCASIEKPPSSQKQRKKWDLEAAKLYWSELNENPNKLCTQYSKNYSYRSTISLPSSAKSSPAHFEYLTISVDNIFNSANSLYSLKEFFPRSPKNKPNIHVDNIISNNEPKESLLKLKINEYYKLKIQLAENEEKCRQLKKMIHKKENEINLIRMTDKKNKPPCKKQLFQQCNYPEKENAAAIIISAYVRGYLLRCLLNTQVVQRTIETIKKLKECTLKDPMKCKSKELDLDRKHTQKLLAASNKLHSVISLPPGKKIAIIRQDRAEVKHHKRMCRPTSAYVTTLSTRRDCLRSAELTYNKCMKRRAHSSNPIDRWHY